jgi:hypothetical protein
MALIQVASLLFALISFAVSQCIYTRQNFDQIRIASFLGLFPLSVGAILRIPLCVVTLLWQHHPAVKASFSQALWADTSLGRFLDRMVFGFLRRLLGTAFWIVTWSIICLAIVTGLILASVLPKDPDTFVMVVSRVAVMVVWLSGVSCIIFKRHWPHRRFVATTAAPTIK